MIGPDEVICTWLLKKGERGKKKCLQVPQWMAGHLSTRYYGSPPKWKWSKQIRWRAQREKWLLIEYLLNTRYCSKLFMWAYFYLIVIITL